MPSVVAGIKAFFVILGFSATTAATLAAYTISTIVSYGISYVAMRLGQKDQNQAADNFESGLKANKIDPVAPIPVVYGKRLVGGSIVYRNLSPDNKIFYQAIVFSEGEIEGIDCLYLNEIPLQLTIPLYDELEPDVDPKYSYTTTHKTVIDEDYKKIIQGIQGKTSTELSKGTDTQFVNTLLTESESWSDDHRGFGVAYVGMRLFFDREIFPNGVPNVTALVKGKKVLNLNTNVVEWSDNPAYCIYDYLTNDRYGCGIPASNIDTASFIAEAAFCDETVTVLNHVGVEAQAKRYVLNGVINTDDTCLSNLNKMLTSCRGMLIFSSGVYKLKIDKLWTETKFAFTENNIVGDFVIAGSSKRAIANKVTTRYFNAYDRFIESLSVISSANFIERDNNTIHNHELKLPFTSQPQRAAALTAMYLKQTREEWALEFSCTLQGLQVEVGDVVAITNQTAGYTEKPFRVGNIVMLDNDTLRISCQEYDDSVYSYDLEVPPTHPDTNLRAGFAPTEVQNLTVSTGTQHLLISAAGVLITRAFVSWQQPSNGFVSHYEVGYKLNSQSDVQWTIFMTTLTEHYLQPISDGRFYDYKVRAIGINGQYGDWRYITNNEAIGKTDPPQDVIGFTFEEDRRFTQIFRWQETGDVDLKGYLIRYSQTTTTWDDMLPLHKNIINNNPYETTLLAEGAYNLAIKAVDTSGNFSANANVIKGVVTDDPRVTIFKQEFPHLLGWTGNKYDSYVGTDGKLYPEDKKPWSSFPTDSIDWDLWNTWVRDPHELRYYHTIDLGSDLTFRPLVQASADGTLDLKIGIAKDGSSDVQDTTAPNNIKDQKFYPSGITVTYPNGTTEGFGSYLEMADNNYQAGDGRVASYNPDFGAKYHTLDGTPTFTSLDSGAAPDAHIYYIEDLGAGNNDSAWSSVLDQTTDGMWVIEDLTAGGIYYYKTNYSISVPTAGITWRNLSTGAVASITLQFINNHAEGNLYSPTGVSGGLVTGRYLSVVATVSGGNNSLDTMQILLDGNTFTEDKEISHTPTHNNQDTFTYTTERDFAQFISVQVTATEAGVNAQVTSLDTNTNQITIAYSTPSSNFSASTQKFYISIKGY